MRYRIYHNLHPDRSDGYRDEHPLWLDPTVYDLGNVKLLPPVIINAQDLILAVHTNRLRPDRDVAPAVTRGDVISIEYHDRWTFYTVGDWEAMYEPEVVVETDDMADAVMVALEAGTM